MPVIQLVEELLAMMGQYPAKAQALLDAGSSPAGHTIIKKINEKVTYGNMCTFK